MAASFTLCVLKKVLIMNKFAKIALPAAALLASMASRAAGTGVDVSPVTSAGTDVAAVIVAVFAVVASIAGGKWIRRAL